jgi:uncharacterized protein (TIGR02246 family)
MKVSSPQDLSRLIIEALNSGDVDVVVSLYEPDGVIAPNPGQIVSGRAAIRSLAAGFLALRPRLILHDTEVVQADDVALVRSRVTQTIIQAEKRIETVLEPILVARRQTDGSWLIAIDRPLTAG